MEMKKIFIYIILIVFTFSLFAISQLEILKDGTPEQKIEAMYHLAYSKNKKGYWYFLKYLDYYPNNNESPTSIRMREAAAYALGRIEYKPGVEFLINRYNKEKVSSVKEKIVYALSFYDTEESNKVILEAIDSKNRDVQFEALIAASRISSKDFSPKLKSVFDNSNDPSFKAVASYGLFKITKEESYVKYLVSGLKNKNPITRYWSAHYISELKHTAALQQLVIAYRIENKYWVRNEMEHAIDSLHYALKARREYNRYKKYEFIMN